MISRSTDFDLGRDKTRIKDPRDADRQHRTVEALLERMFDRSAKRRREVQVLADEVGMGKTFVALGVAYSVLRFMEERGAVGDLEGCYQKVLIITPTNAALFQKWQREVGEFVKRCVAPDAGASVASWFRPSKVERLDELAAELRRSGSGSRVLVSDMGLFAGRKFQDYALKRRLLLGQIFRLWGVRFPEEERLRLLRGAPASWGVLRPGDCDACTEEERDSLPLSPDEMYTALQRFAGRNGEEASSLAALLESCREIAVPFTRDRASLFGEVERRLTEIYRAICSDVIRRAIPLVVVDEAHNWKNGPSSGANGYRKFVAYVARRTRRALLLTATPFQLRPEEMLELLKVGEDLEPSATAAASKVRREFLEALREKDIQPVIKVSASASRRFQKAWGRLPSGVSAASLEAVWASEELERARKKLRALANEDGIAPVGEVDAIAKAATAHLDPDHRELLREALRLYCFNSDLSRELGAFVIRHRRRSDHRLFRVGSEHQPNIPLGPIAARPDAHVLHHAAGLDVHGEGELPHYVLMRCVSEMKNGRGRSSLGSALTGCYSTLLESAEGRALKGHMNATPAGSTYLRLLLSMVDAKHDHRHPKLETVVDEVMKAWHAGEKSLIFCFRVNTAERLRDIIARRVRVELGRRQKRCLGGTQQLKTLKTRLTGRDRDLVPVGLDRVLWSFHWGDLYEGRPSPLTPRDLVATEDDVRTIAELALTFGVDLEAERVDRVFLHRATEHAIAVRLLREKSPAARWERLLRAMAHPELGWVSHPYGDSGDDDSRRNEGGGEVEQTAFDERGAQKSYPRGATPNRAEVDARTKALMQRVRRARQQGQLSVFDVYAHGPNLWLGPAPHALAAADDGQVRPIVAELHHHLTRLTEDGTELDWRSRRAVIAALRRAMLRDSVLLRVLPDRAEAEEEGWGELLAESLFRPLRNQRESMADRMAVFLEDIVAASGDVADRDTARGGFLDATWLRDQSFVALVDGSTKRETKERIFAGFNTPLLPEVLICTSVGQEGIDLHRHCRHVVHYDLAWNPAVLEQRTGRADRIGSKTFRERARARAGEEPTFLEVGVPFLAGTYDERMYEELRLRSQMFEVLTGGDFAVENAEGSDEYEGTHPDGGSTAVVPLPLEMLGDLRVKLHVWADSPNGRHASGSSATRVTSAGRGGPAAATWPQR